MATERSIDEINAKIRRGTVRVLTAAELKAAVRAAGVTAVAAEVDVIATGTFEPMESSGAILNIGHTDPPIRLAKAWLNGVEAYCGFGAVDLYLGAAQMGESLDYGGGHVIAELVAGRSVRLRATGLPADCYPRRDYESQIQLAAINQAYLFNPRNVYQNFIVGVNGGDRPLYTYLGTLQPRLGNAVYASVGALSPLLNDALLRSVGIGTRIFLGGGTGYIAWEGTQHFPSQKRLPNGSPVGPAATLALIGDLKQMDPFWVRGCRFYNYGPSLMLGVGIPLPVTDETVVAAASLADGDLVAPVIDFSIPRRVRPTFGLVSYAQLKSGQITIEGQKVRTAPLASTAFSLRVAQVLKEWIASGRFELTQPVASLPAERPLLAQERPLLS
ncbi:homocysteine biosynthesis protein [Gloeobacter violaceus]|uniref:Glr3673 protein n=1 Tax=Gloeobacter violaceus (strain ATCC 29082 / PCC 7421) TaxID=251221 RepID=Q7NF53_GLOVI|nr:homocysteine biosynthesis protein [Gloeobacter violaceus]BAC91614.1 glr3673 [Gloeobacter violaceus PCC 7421]